MKYSPNQLPLLFNEPTAGLSPVAEEVVEEQANPNLGYKHTALGWIPEDWEIREVGGCFDLVNGVAFKPEDWKSAGMPIIRIQNLNDDNAEFNFYDGEIDEKYIIKPGDLLFAWSGTKGVSFGARVWKGETAVLNQHIFKVHPRPVNVVSNFAYYLLKLAQNSIEKNAHGFKSSFVHVTKRDVEKVKLPLPPVPEQRAIANLLTTWDKAISTITQLIAQKEKRKKWLMGQLLTGKKRLPGFGGEWKKTGAGKIFINSSLKGYANEELLSVTQDNGVIPRSMLEARVTMPSGETGSFKLVEIGDFVISLRSFQGGLEYSYHRGIVSPAYTVLKPLKKINPEFYKFYFKSYDFIGHLAVAVIGIRDGKQINYEEFCTVEIPDPSEQEQTAIAAVLQAADREIGLLRQKLEKLKEQKKGLMQVLLTGKVRLSVER